MPVVPALAQEAATAGGDVTADEATPLPPIVVESPAESRKPKKVSKVKSNAPSAPSSSQNSGGAATSSQGVPGGDTATEGTSTEPGEGSAEAIFETPGVFTLGQLDLIGGSTITSEAMYTFNKNSLDKALNILPGVSIQQSGNSRNERDIQVRGFDRLRVPLYMDGVRVYLPADNRLDFARFLTPDAAEVQVQKGYVSVLNGPGGLGGAVNVVSRKPTKPFEAEARVGTVLNGDLSDMNQWSSYAFAGTRQQGFYAQVSGTIVDQDHFNLSEDFRPGSAAGTPGFIAGYPFEDGGDRDHSDFKDWRINGKVGFTPNATDEYAISYTTQANERGSPLHTDGQAVQGIFFFDKTRYWSWDDWSTSQLSWLSKTQIGSASYIKTNAYYSTFGSTLFFHDNPTFTTRFDDSIYEDHNTGGSIELGTELIPMNTLKGAIHYRKDVHTEYDQDYEFIFTNNFQSRFVGRTPTERNAEETWSFALENTFHAAPFLDLVAGVSYDKNEVLRAEFTDNTDDRNPVIGSQPELPKIDAWNWQGAAILNYSATGSAHFSVSSRTRFATLFERYSTRFGTRSVDPDLDPERSTNYEIGVSETLFPGLKVSAAVFYSDIKDNIQNAFYAPNGNNSIIGFNVDGETRGLELSADWDATKTIRVGGNYTYIERDFDYFRASLGIAPFLPSNAQNRALTAAAVASVQNYQPEGTPTHKGFGYLSWLVTPQLTLTPSIELASDRTVIVTSCESTLLRRPPNAIGNHANCIRANTPTNNANRNIANARPNFTDIGWFALVNFQAEYAFTDNASLALGVTNLLDQNYELADGFPEPGRQFYVNMRAKF